MLVGTTGKNLESIFNWNVNIFLGDNGYKNVNYEMAAIFSRISVC